MAMFVNFPYFATDRHAMDAYLIAVVGLFAMVATAYVVTLAWPVAGTCRHDAALDRARALRWWRITSDNDYARLCAANGGVFPHVELLDGMFGLNLTTRDQVQRAVDARVRILLRNAEGKK